MKITIEIDVALIILVVRIIIDVLTATR